MKAKIHPNYIDATIVCSCGNQWQTRSTRERVHLDVDVGKDSLHLVGRPEPDQR